MNSEQHHFRDSQDLVRWIDNKLGQNELWGGRQASFVLNYDILVELETCFQELEPHIKLKIIQAMVHLSPKTLQIWKSPLSNLIEIARQDPEDWVETIADIYRSFPEDGFIQFSSKPDSYFCRTQIELEKIVESKIREPNFFHHVPPDSQYMSKSMINAIFPDDSTKRIQHFSLIVREGKPTKSSKLLEDVKKAAEQQSNPSTKKNHGLISSFPIKIRSTAKKLDNSLPMKGIPSANTLKMSSGFTNESKKYHQRTMLNRVGGAMLIDIAELPNPGGRRKRNAEPINMPPSQNDKKKCTNAKMAHLTTSTNKISSVAKKKETAANSIDDDDDHKGEGQQEIGEKTMEQGAKNEDVSISAADDQNCQQNSTLPSSSNYNQPAFVSLQQFPSLTDDPSISSSAFISPPQFTAELSNKVLPESHQQSGKQIPQSSQLHFQNGLPANNNATNFIAPMSSTNLPIHHQSSPVILPANGNKLQSPENLSNIIALQQFDALLKDANKLTPMTYNLIISFLSGNKKNVLEDKLGSVITLPFAESIEFEPLPVGVGMTANLVEVFFQIDYRTGEWKRLKKTRILRPEEMSQYSHLLNVKKEQEPVPIHQLDSSSYTNGQWKWDGTLSGRAGP